MFVLVEKLKKNLNSRHLGLAAKRGTVRKFSHEKGLFWLTSLRYCIDKVIRNNHRLKMCSFQQSWNRNMFYHGTCFETNFCFFSKLQSSFN